MKKFSTQALIAVSLVSDDPMVNMSESEAGAILMAVPQHKHQHHSGGDAAMMSDDMDSEPEEAPTMLNMIQAYGTGVETKRNKRKNFKPRNIETNPISSSQHRIGEDEGNGLSDNSHDSFDNSEYALDLSSSDMIKKGAKRQRTASPVERDNLPAPMDLSCSRSHSKSISSERKDSESLCSDSESNPDPEPTVNGYHSSKYSPEPCRSYLFPPFLNQPTDASDLKEYAERTVKELLEIYGLNSDVVTDVAESITKNVPMSNFSSGK